MDDIEFLVCDVAILWRRVFNAKAKTLGISNIERRIIINVARNFGATQIEVARLIDIEPQNLTKPLDKLIAQGLLEKQQDPADRRVKRLYLTKQCKPLLKKIQALGDTIRPLIMQGMTVKETHDLSTQLEQMKCSLEQYLANNS